MTILRRRIADKELLDLIWKFLKAGVMQGQLFAKTETGVPQGGVISPLLANVYLNEFDKWAEQRWHNLNPYERSKSRKAGLGNYTMVRYADDFVIASNDKGRNRADQRRSQCVPGRRSCTWNSSRKRRHHPRERRV